MKNFLDILNNIKSLVLINQNDSEIDKAKKVMWYAFLGSILIITILSWFIFVSLTFSTSNVKVPHIENDHVYTALKKLADKNLIAHVITDYSEKYQAGTVFEQKPGQGAIVKKGRNVTFKVSLGLKISSFPNFYGYSLFDLADYLDDKYFNAEIPYQVLTPVYEFNEKIEKGRIFKQEPAAGVSLKSVKEVRLWISNGPKANAKKLLGNYVDYQLHEVIDEIAAMEILYNINFNITHNKKKDLIITDQSIGEGVIVDDLVKENKMLILNVEKYLKNKDEEIQGLYSLELPQKPLPYQLTIKLKDVEALEETMLAVKTKGGMALNLPYSAMKYSKILTYIEDDLYAEYTVEEEKALD